MTVSTAPDTAGIARSELVLTHEFDATIGTPELDEAAVPPASPRGSSSLLPSSISTTGMCRVAHAPLGSVGKNSNMSLAYFPDGAWVLFPLVF
jgi:hypothetical protein